MPEPALGLDVVASLPEAAEALLDGRNVVVIDVLRATTVIGQALAAGAARILPAATPAEARELAAGLEPGSFLLGGERGGYRIPGFDLGNSPLEYTPERVKGKSIVLASTNGSVLLARCRRSRRTLALSFNNLSAVAARVRDAGGSWVAVCSGKLGRACLEDLVCAGRLGARLGLAGEEGPADSLDDARDGLTIARLLDERLGGDLAEMLRRCAHGRYLESIGFGPDLERCAQLDILAGVPEMAGGAILPG
jgi:2-phosphosulfolactate phosphatase